jgi:hypothetical protein
MTKFDQTLNYFQKLFLSESPIRTGKAEDNVNEDIDTNKINAAEIAENLQATDTFTFKGIKLSLFRDRYEGTKIEDNWLSDEPFIASQFNFIEENGGLNASGV